MQGIGVMHGQSKIDSRLLVKYTSNTYIVMDSKVLSASLSIRLNLILMSKMLSVVDKKKKKVIYDSKT